MPNATPAAPPVSAAALDVAFQSLLTYDLGSSRAALLPIDDAVRAAIAEPEIRTVLERRLIDALPAARPAVAREFICSKLALIGTATAVEALGGLLGDARLATAARNALDSIPGPEAARVLRAGLAATEGVQKLGVIQSLGIRRDHESAAELIALLSNGEQSIASAAAAALGEIGTADAAKALIELEPRTRGELASTLHDACLVCAERSSAEGRHDHANSVYRLLLTDGHPDHVRAAARRGLQLASAAKE